MKIVRGQTFKILACFSIFLTIFGLCLLMFSICSSAWQVVYLRELHVYHQHGVWWDCIQQDGRFYSSSRILRRRSALFPDLKCSHKFDVAAQEALDSAIAEGDVAARELQLHRILPQHKAVLLLTVLTMFFGVLGVSAGVLSICFKLCTLFHGTLLFLSASCSGLADLIFLLAAARINIRYVPGIVDIYEQHLGLAVLVHGTASLILFMSFFVSVISACVFISTTPKTKRRYSSEDYCHYQSPELRSFQKNSMDMTIENDHCDSLHPEVDELKRDSASAVSLL